MLVGGIIHTVRSVDREIERGFECHRNHLNWLWARKKIMPLRSLLLTQYRRSMSFTFHVSIYRVAIKSIVILKQFFMASYGVFRTFFARNVYLTIENTIRKRPYREMLRWVMLRIGGCGPPQSCFA